jgi:hypothetical protein
LVHFTPKGPDLAPSDFYMFGPMKEALRGWRFSFDKEVIDAVQNWLKTQAKNFFWRNLKKIATRTSALKSKGITLKSNISFVSVLFTGNVFF